MSFKFRVRFHSNSFIRSFIHVQRICRMNGFKKFVKTWNPFARLLGLSCLTESIHVQVMNGKSISIERGKKTTVSQTLLAMYLGTVRKMNV